jgi:hypothetical protein
LNLVRVRSFTCASKNSNLSFYWTFKNNLI